MDNEYWNDILEEAFQKTLNSSRKFQRHKNMLEEFWREINKVLLVQENTTSEALEHALDELTKSLDELMALAENQPEQS